MFILLLILKKATNHRVTYNNYYLPYKCEMSDALSSLLLCTYDKHLACLLCLTKLTERCI